VEAPAWRVEARRRGAGRRAHRHVVHELEVGHRGGVALARPDLDDARVAAGPLREARGDVGEKQVGNALRAEEGDGLPLGGDVAALSERDHLLDDRPHLLRLRLGRLDAAVLDQRAGEVRVERLAVGRVPAQLPACAVVPHAPATRP
jgi:hypothetical protein